MSASVWPLIGEAELRAKENESTARELEWLLDSFQETLVSLKTGLEECYALLAPIEPGSTLVMSSPRSESVKGVVTRVGTQIVKGSLHLRLKTLPHMHLALSADSPLTLRPLASLRSLLNEALDCVDVTRWTGDRHSASFISGQLRLLHSIITEAKSNLKGPNLVRPQNSSSTTLPPDTEWCVSPSPSDAFTPPLPPNLSLQISVSDASLILIIRVLESATAIPNLGSRFAYAIGAQRRLEHDEMDDVFSYHGEEVRVKEKVKVESGDPNLISAMAKLAALEHTVAIARNCLATVMGEEEDDD
ncbi:RAVE subunit 2/Rogdi [Xylogone sp. PMI_703]|nr:RAVE subunit 2/Rogdi [Xylogone sp. PMI_703]